MGTADMTPAVIKEEAAQAGLKDVRRRRCSVAWQGHQQGATGALLARYM